mmetsp:Transcript_54695/g.144521  ORF Transcript_54695/g.144521 Transcript_54695/m.144521 type:complete len:81 (+) Transcript_54695:70-312(+)
MPSSRRPAGLRQKIFMPPACVFHQFHPQGIMPQRVAETITDQVIEDFIRNVTTMLRDQEPLILNGPDWGYGDMTFREELV